jgi:hypothetical protein
MPEVAIHRGSNRMLSFISKNTGCLTHVGLLLMAILSVANQAAAQELAATPFTVAGAEKLDSETLLIQRRALRTKQLAAAPTPPEVSTPAFNAIDQFIAAAWKKAGLDAYQHPPEVCDDATFARRVYLDIIGVTPSLTDLSRFLIDRSPQKRAKLVDALLARKSDYAAHWTPFWEDALASQNVAAQGFIPTRGNYRDWLLHSFESNRPYDVMVAELLDPTMPGKKRVATEDLLGVKYRIEFVRNEDHLATLQTAANVGQVFLGTGMKCASCHDHFENRDWTQDRFLGFASLFAAKNLERIRCDVKSGQFVPAKFPFNVPGAPTEPPEDLKGRLHLLAQLVTDPANPRFSETIVNRLWKRYLGWGLIEPVDDYRADSAASHPELLAWLARDFLEHGCDLQHTMRLILTSRTYQLRYDPSAEDHYAAGMKNEPRYFRSPALRRLTAEQMIDSVRLAASGQLAAGERAFLDNRSTALSRVLGRPASRNEISTARSDDAAVVQALELLNGTELYELTDPTIQFNKPIPKSDFAKVVDRFYRAVLSRPATADEKRAGQTFLASYTLTTEGLRDLVWALVCSPEFQYIK